MQITCYSVVTSMFSDQITKYIGYMEITVGLGLGLGPIIGSFLFRFLKYEGTMYMFGGLCLFATVLCSYLIPDAINDVYSFDEMAELEVEGEEFEEELSKENKKKIRKINIVTLI